MWIDIVESSMKFIIHFRKRFAEVLNKNVYKITTFVLFIQPKDLSKATLTGTNLS